MMHYNKNDSQIKILKILCIWANISKTSILNHIYYVGEVGEPPTGARISGPKILEDSALKRNILHKRGLGSIANYGSLCWCSFG